MAQVEQSNLTTHYDIAIVGGGIAGSLLACLLESTRLKVALLEFSKTSAAAERGQAYSINQMSSRIFAGLGIWHRIRPDIETYRNVHLSDADHPGIVHFSPQDTQTQTLGYVAEHRVLLRELQNQMQQCQNVDLLCPAKVTDIQFQPGQHTLTVDHDGTIQTIQARLVVGADGSRSLLRQCAGISTIGWKYWQACVVAFIKPEQFHKHIAYERFQADGPFAILPLPGNICRIVWTAPQSESERLLQIDKSAFLAQLSQRYGEQMGRLELLGERSMFPVQLAHSQKYVKQGLALVGDAAHCCHPVGGQGINLGIRDVAALAEVIQTAIDRGEDFAKLSVLKRYERWRMWENLIMLGFTDILTRTFSNQIAPIVWMRRRGLWAMEHIQPVKSFAIKLMLGLIGRVPKIAATEPQEPPSNLKPTSLTSSSVSQ